jgi:hypothetical protein
MHFCFILSGWGRVRVYISLLEQGGLPGCIVARLCIGAADEVSASVVRIRRRLAYSIGHRGQ